MNLTITEPEALALYRILCRRDTTGVLAANDPEETQLLWDLQCVLEKELEPVNANIAKRLV